MASDSEQYEPTLSSVRCILANASHFQTPTVLKTTLLGLPNLFLSLATREEGCGGTAAAAKYLKIMIDSFRTEDLVVKHAKSSIQSVRSVATLSLTRLFRIYAAASLVASGKQCDELCRASSYIWEQLNPKTSGMNEVILSFTSLDGCYSSSSDSLERSIFSDHGLITVCLTKDDPPLQWMANLVYLQSWLNLVPDRMIRASNALEFFSDKQHYTSLVEFAEEVSTSQ